MASFPSSRRVVGVLGFTLLGLLLLAPQGARGQVWLQTAEVITPVEQGPVRAFLDSLVNTLERREIEVYRSPDREEELTISELRTRLIEEQGIGVNSANHAFIGYRFSIDNGGTFQQQIASIHFVFRPGPGQSDIPVLYIDVRKVAWLDHYLRNTGTTLQTNQAAFIPFQRHLGFANIARQEKTRVVQIAGETVREGFEEEKEALIRKVERLTYV